MLVCSGPRTVEDSWYTQSREGGRTTERPLATISKVYHALCEALLSKGFVMLLLLIHLSLLAVFPFSIH